MQRSDYRIRWQDRPTQAKGIEVILGEEATQEIRNLIRDTLYQEYTRRDIVRTSDTLEFITEQLNSLPDSTWSRCELGQAFEQAVVKVIRGYRDENGGESNLEYRVAVLDSERNADEYNIAQPAAQPEPVAPLPTTTEYVDTLLDSLRQEITILRRERDEFRSMTMEDASPHR